MPRKRAVEQREVLPDAVYGSEMLSRFINHIMLSGKKSIAEKIVYGALEIVVEKQKKQAAAKDKDEGEGGSTRGGSGAGTGNVALDLLEQALDNIRPSVEVRSRRVGGATYQVPVEVRKARKDTLAMRWIIGAARDRSEKGMVARLAGEIVDALNSRGNAVKKREDMHKMAKANQAFAHFRWT